MGTEYRCLGPPGTGKTTYLKRQIEKAASKHGSDEILVASFTKAAAVELAARRLPIPDANIGTVHAHCYRAMNYPEIAELHIDSFNEACPQYAMSKGKTTKLDEMSADAEFQTEGDKLMAYYNRHRALCLPLDKLPSPVFSFMKAWESWKLANDFVDFTDMISMTALAGGGPPGEQRIGIYDEAQDFSRLETQLIRAWARHQDFVILAGDDDQLLYSFTGATPDAFLGEEVPPENKRVLSQSWRVPELVHAYANNWIRTLSRREEKEYRPRDEKGELRYFEKGGSYRMPQYIIEDAERYLAKGKRVMFLTTCGYMLTAIRDILKSNGVPYHNPYRKNRGDWNPLGHSTAKQTATRDRILAFTSASGITTPEGAFWSGDELARWVPLVKTEGVFLRGKRRLFEDRLEDFGTWYNPDIYRFMLQYWEEPALKAALARDIDWLQRNTASQKVKAAEYPFKILRTRGEDGLSQTPQIILSTIHGVKGGEAECVYVFPDLSLNAMQGWVSNLESKDATIRTFYVGMTRAKESLILCKPASKLSVAF